MGAEPVLVLGGTFDPVHRGHEAIAEAAQDGLGVERLLWMPAAAPPHKQSDGMTPAKDRESMVRRAIEGRPGWELCRIELENSKLRYTVDSLRELRSQGLAPVFILGLDSLRQLTDWRNYGALVAEFDLAVVDRIDRDGPPRRIAPEIRDRLQRADRLAPGSLGQGGRVLVVPMQPVEISSSLIRQRVQSGEPIDSLVAPAVARYIRERNLYRIEEGSALSSSLPEAVRLAVESVADRRARDLVVLDLHGLSDVTDYFVIAHASSERQVQAIAEHVQEMLRERLRVKPIHVEGKRVGEWILLDYIDFVVHLFVEEKRDFYRLERLWGDAPRIDISAWLPEEERPDFGDGSHPATAGP